VVACIQQQHPQAAAVQQRGKGQHVLGVATPTVQHRHHRLGPGRRRRDQPAEQLLAADGGNAHLAVGEPEIGGTALLEPARGAKAAAYQGRGGEPGQQYQADQKAEGNDQGLGDWEAAVTVQSVPLILKPPELNARSGREPLRLSLPV